MTQPLYFALIPAAGIGARLGADIPKQYLSLAGKPMLRHTVDAFSACARIAHTFVVASPNDGWVDDVILADSSGVTVLRCGGAMRRDSVLNGLQAMQAQVAEHDWVLVHDAARPGLTPALIEKLIATISDDPVGGLLALPVADTIKRVVNGVLETVPREGMWLAQTPQMFRYGQLQQALQAHKDVTDEASAIESMGLMPRLVHGHVRNSKVTLPADMELVGMYLTNAAEDEPNQP